MCLLIDEFWHPRTVNLLLHFINFKEDGGHLGFEVLIGLMCAFYEERVFCVLKFKVNNFVLVLVALLKEEVDKQHALFGLGVHLTVQLCEPH